MGKPKTYKAEVVVELSAPLFLDSKFMRLLKSARIGGVDVHVVLPKFGRVLTEADTVLHPRAEVDWIGSFRQRDREEDRNPFGGVSRWLPSGGVKEFSAHRMLVLPRGRVTLAEARAIIRSADDWVALLETWIEVITREDLHRDHVRVDRQGQAAFVWIDRDKKPKGLLPGKHEIILNFGDTLRMSRWQWGKILAKTSDGVSPPEAHAFVRDARQAKNAGQYRRSVLDSATAAEVALAKLRDDALVDSSLGLTKYVQGKAQQIGQLTQFLSVIGRPIPERVQQEIGEPRNRAIHEGDEADEQTAEAALAKAEEVVDLAFPWKEILRH